MSWSFMKPPEPIETVLNLIVIIVIKFALMCYYVHYVQILFRAMVLE